MKVACTAILRVGFVDIPVSLETGIFPSLQTMRLVISCEFLTMAFAAENPDQTHPQEKRDRQIVNTLLQGQPEDHNLAELARLKIRYRGFPGAREIQRDLESVLQKWQLTEEQLYERTRQIHATTQIYKVRSNKRQEEEDWS